MKYELKNVSVTQTKGNESTTVKVEQVTLDLSVWELKDCAGIFKELVTELVKAQINEPEKEEYPDIPF